MALIHFLMFPPFGCCPVGDEGGHDNWRRHQQRKLRMLQFWRDGVERQLAAVNAAISTLEQQIVRDGGSSGS